VFDKADFTIQYSKDEYRCPAARGLFGAFTTFEPRINLQKYWCQPAAMSSQSPSTTCVSPDRHDGEHEDVIEVMQRTSESNASSVEDPPSDRRTSFEDAEAWDGQNALLTKTLPPTSVRDELHVLEYNPKRVMQIFGLPQSRSIRA